MILSDEQTNKICMACEHMTDMGICSLESHPQWKCPIILEAQEHQTREETLRAVEDAFRVDCTEGGTIKDYTGYDGMLAASPQGWAQFKARLVKASMPKGE